MANGDACNLKLKWIWAWRDGSVVTTLAALTEDLRLAPRTKMAAHNCLYLQSQGSQDCLLTSKGSLMHVMHMNSHRHAHTHIQINKSLEIKWIQRDMLYNLFIYLF